MQLPKVHLAGSSSSAVDLSFQIFCCFVIFLKIRRPFVEGKKVIRK